MPIIGYCRVSTDEQTTETQELTIRRYASANGLLLDNFVSENISSRKADRLIYNLISSMDRGDILIVTKLDRLGRGTADVLTIIESIKSKGIKLIIVEDNITVDVDNQSAIGQMILTVLSAFAQLERDFISERTKVALRARKEQGVKLGRKKGAIVKSKYDAYNEDIINQLKLGVSLNQIIRNIGIGSVASLSAYVKTRKLNQ